jgi:hypothetical protein
MSAVMTMSFAAACPAIQVVRGVEVAVHDDELVLFSLPDPHPGVRDEDGLDAVTLGHLADFLFHRAAVGIHVDANHLSLLFSVPDRPWDFLRRYRARDSQTPFGSELFAGRKPILGRSASTGCAINCRMAWKMA